MQRSLYLLPSPTSLCAQFYSLTRPRTDVQNLQTQFHICLQKQNPRDRKAQIKSPRVYVMDTADIRISLLHSTQKALNTECLSYSSASVHAHSYVTYIMNIYVNCACVCSNSVVYIPRISSRCILISQIRFTSLILSILTNCSNHFSCCCSILPPLIPPSNFSTFCYFLSRLVTILIPLRDFI